MSLSVSLEYHYTITVDFLIYFRNKLEEKIFAFSNGTIFVTGSLIALLGRWQCFLSIYLTDA